MNDVLQAILIIGSLTAMIWALLKFMLRDIHKDLTDIKDAQKRSEARIDHLFEENNRIYRTLIDMVKKK